MRAPALLLVLFSLAPAPVWAQDELGVTAEVERPIAGTGGDDPTASATAVEVADRPRPVERLEDALREVPGARPLASGAYGAPATLSLRGSDADQVEVLFGDVPLTTADGSPFDLSSVPLWLLRRVEVYRGGAPTWWAGGGMGGLVRLVPREASGTRLDVSGAVGSFGLLHGRLASSVGGGPARFLAAVGLSRVAGDFPVQDDGRTALDASDDGVRLRRNAQLSEGSGLGHLVVPVAGGELRVLGFGLARHGGVPGPASQPTSSAHRSEVSLLGGISWDAMEGGRRAEDASWRFSLGAASGFRRRRFTDLFGEVGLGVPTATQDEAYRAVARMALTGRVLPWLELTGALRYVREQLAPHDRLARTQAANSERDAGNVALEARFSGRAAGWRFELRPSARLAIVGSRLHDIAALRYGEATDAWSVAPTARLGGVIEPVPGVAISASFATATRVPNMVELFGDRAFLSGDAQLRPERSESVDLGLALRGRAGPVRGQLELRGFVTFANDLIRYVRDSRFRATPQNVDQAILSGVELGFRGRITPHFRCTGALSLLETWTPYLGATRRLPLRPGMTAYLRPEARVLELAPLTYFSLWTDLSFVSSTFWDPANRSTIPERLRVGIGGSFALWDGRLRIDLHVRDALDARGADLLGFPLPGRSLGVGLRLRTD